MPITKLSWGVKQSFRSYVEAMGGKIDVGEGASRTPDGVFAFPAGPGEGLALGDDGRPKGRGDFTGDVRFEAHGGMLSVYLADPAIEVGPDGAILTVAETPARTRRSPIAKLDLAAAAPGDDGGLVIPAAATLDGMMILGDHYPPGTPLDPVILR